MKTTLPPNKYRDLVNELHDTVIIYGRTQQLRAQLEKTVSRYIKAEKPLPVRTNNEGNG